MCPLPLLCPPQGLGLIAYHATSKLLWRTLQQRGAGTPHPAPALTRGAMLLCGPAMLWCWDIYNKRAQEYRADEVRRAAC